MVMGGLVEEDRSTPVFYLSEFDKHVKKYYISVDWLFYSGSTDCRRRFADDKFRFHQNSLLLGVGIFNLFTKNIAGNKA